MKVAILFGLLVTVLGMAEEKIYVTFRRLDKDQDGKLQLKDLLSYFDRYDVNDDGFLSYQEFTDGLYPEIPKVAFHFFDALDGTQDVKVARGCAKVILNRLDHDSDGEVSYPEFTHTFPMFKADLIEAVEFLSS